MVERRQKNQQERLKNSENKTRYIQEIACHHVVGFQVS